MTESTNEYLPSTRSAERNTKLEDALPRLVEYYHDFLSDKQRLIESITSNGDLSSIFSHDLLNPESQQLFSVYWRRVGTSPNQQPTSEEIVDELGEAFVRSLLLKSSRVIEKLTSSTSKSDTRTLKELVGVLPFAHRKKLVEIARQLPESQTYYPIKQIIGYVEGGHGDDAEYEQWQREGRVRGDTIRGKRREYTPFDEATHVFQQAILEQTVVEAVANARDAYLEDTTGRFGKGIVSTWQWLTKHRDARFSVLSKNQSGETTGGYVRASGGEFFFAPDQNPEQEAQNQAKMVLEAFGIDGNLDHGTVIRVDAPMNADKLLDEVRWRFSDSQGVNIWCATSDGRKMLLNEEASQLRKVGSNGPQESNGDVYIYLSDEGYIVLDQGSGLTQPGKTATEVLYEKFLVPGRSTKKYSRRDQESNAQLLVGETDSRSVEPSISVQVSGITVEQYQVEGRMLDSLPTDRAVISLDTVTLDESRTRILKDKEYEYNLEVIIGQIEKLDDPMDRIRHANLLTAALRASAGDIENTKSEDYKMFVSMVSRKIRPLIQGDLETLRREQGVQFVPNTDSFAHLDAEGFVHVDEALFDFSPRSIGEKSDRWRGARVYQLYLADFKDDGQYHPLHFEHEGVLFLDRVVYDRLIQTKEGTDILNALINGIDVGYPQPASFKGFASVKAGEFVAMQESASQRGENSAESSRTTEESFDWDQTMDEFIRGSKHMHMMEMHMMRSMRRGGRHDRSEMEQTTLREWLRQTQQNIEQDLRTLDTGTDQRGHHLPDDELREIGHQFEMLSHTMPELMFGLPWDFNQQWSRDLVAKYMDTYAQMYGKGGEKRGVYSMSSVFWETEFGQEMLGRYIGLEKILRMDGQEMPDITQQGLFEGYRELLQGIDTVDNPWIREQLTHAFDTFEGKRLVELGMKLVEKKWLDVSDPWVQGLIDKSFNEAKSLWNEFQDSQDENRRLPYEFEQFVGKLASKQFDMTNQDWAREKVQDVLTLTRELIDHHRGEGKGFDRQAQWINDLFTQVPLDLEWSQELSHNHLSFIESAAFDPAIATYMLEGFATNPTISANSRDVYERIFNILRQTELEDDSKGAVRSMSYVVSKFTYNPSAIELGADTLNQWVELYDDKKLHTSDSRGGVVENERNSLFTSSHVDQFDQEILLELLENVNFKHVELFLSNPQSVECDISVIEKALERTKAEFEKYADENQNSPLRYSYHEDFLEKFFSHENIPNSENLARLYQNMIDFMTEQSAPLYEGRVITSWNFHKDRDQERIILANQGGTLYMGRVLQTICENPNWDFTDPNVEAFFQSVMGNVMRFRDKHPEAANQAIAAFVHNPSLKEGFQSPPPYVEKAVTQLEQAGCTFARDFFLPQEAYLPGLLPIHSNPESVTMVADRVRDLRNVLGGEFDEVRMLYQLTKTSRENPKLADSLSTHRIVPLLMYEEALSPELAEQVSKLAERGQLTVPEDPFEEYAFAKVIATVVKHGASDQESLLKNVQMMMNETSLRTLFNQMYDDIIDNPGGLSRQTEEMIDFLSSDIRVLAEETRQELTQGDLSGVTVGQMIARKKRGADPFDTSREVEADTESVMKAVHSQSVRWDTFVRELLQNARDAVIMNGFEVEGGQIDMRMYREAEGGEIHGVFEISDQGIGMDMDVIKNKLLQFNTRDLEKAANPLVEGGIGWGFGTVALVADEIDVVAIKNGTRSITRLGIVRENDMVTDIVILADEQQPSGEHPGSSIRVKLTQDIPPEWQEKIVRNAVEHYARPISELMPVSYQSEDLTPPEQEVIGEISYSGETATGEQRSGTLRVALAQRQDYPWADVRRRNMSLGEVEDRNFGLTDYIHPTIVQLLENQGLVLQVDVPTWLPPTRVRAGLAVPKQEIDRLKKTVAATVYRELAQRYREGSWYVPVLASDALYDVDYRPDPDIKQEAEAFDQLLSGSTPTADNIEMTKYTDESVYNLQHLLMNITLPDGRSLNEIRQSIIDDSRNVASSGTPLSREIVEAMMKLSETPVSINESLDELYRRIDLFQKATGINIPIDIISEDRSFADMGRLRIKLSQSLDEKPFAEFVATYVEELTHVIEAISFYSEQGRNATPLIEAFVNHVRPGLWDRVRAGEVSETEALAAIRRMVLMPEERKVYMQTHTDSKATPFRFISDRLLEMAAKNYQV